MQILNQTPNMVDTKKAKYQNNSHHNNSHNNNKHKLVADNLALQKLQRKCKAKLLAMLSQFLPELESQEVLQEALFKIFLIAKQDPSPLELYDKLDRLEPLLFTVAKNLAISKIRHRQVRERYLASQELAQQSATEQATEELTESLEVKVAKEKEHELLEDAIHQLPPICQKVFIARKIQGKSHNDIAQQFHISKKTVENHITKGLKLCREYIWGRVNKRLSSPVKHAACSVNPMLENKKRA